MKVKIYHYNQKLVKGKLVHNLVPMYLGYVEVEKFDADEIWNLCNWGHWTNEKPSNLYAEIYSCSHGLCLVNPETQERWLAKSVGWLAGDEKTISKYVLDNRYEVIWK